MKPSNQSTDALAKWLSTLVKPEPATPDERRELCRLAIMVGIANAALEK